MGTIIMLFRNALTLPKAWLGKAFTLLAFKTCIIFATFLGIITPLLQPSGIILWTMGFPQILF